MKVLLLIVLSFVQFIMFSATVAKADVGQASYYGNEFVGRRTASGARYNHNLLTCAHRKYPFGTKLRVTNLKNKKSVIVLVNDRGPYIHGRIIDLSRLAASNLGIIRSGTGKVKVERI